MGFFAEGRLSDSPFVEAVWRGSAEEDISLMCPADGRWNIVWTRLRGKLSVSVEGPSSRAMPSLHAEGVEWLAIKLKLGAYLPCMAVRDCLDGSITLPDAASKAFWLKGVAWEVPDYENADTFVERLAHEEILSWDPVVRAVVEEQEPEKAIRTVRHRFAQRTGLSPNHIRRIERARTAMELLGHGAPILDVVYNLGYADQPHMTRALKRFMGYTPAQIAGIGPVW